MAIENILITQLTNHIGRKTNNPYKKLGDLYVWEESDAVRLAANVGSIFKIETDRSSKFPKIVNIIGISNKPADAIVVKQAPISVAPQEVAKALIKEETLLISKDKPNSRTYGKGADQVKLYFKDASDLDEQVRTLYNLHLMPLYVITGDRLGLKIKEAKEVDFAKEQADAEPQKVLNP